MAHTHSYTPVTFLLSQKPFALSGVLQIVHFLTESTRKEPQVLCKHVSGTVTKSIILFNFDNFSFYYLKIDRVLIVTLILTFLICVLPLTEKKILFQLILVIKNF